MTRTRHLTAVMLLCALWGGFAQQQDNPFTNDAAGNKADSTTVRILDMQDSAAADGQQSPPQAYRHPHNPFALGGGDGGASHAPAQRGVWSRLRIDCARAMTVAAVQVEPATIATHEGYGFSAYAGVDMPLAAWLHAGAGVAFMELRYRLEDGFASSLDTAKGIGTYVQITTQEELRYVVCALHVMARVPGMRSFPYLRVSLDPAVFVSGNYRAVQTDSTVYRDESTLYYERSRNVDITGERNRAMLFGGMGAGYEYHYGYGAVYVQAMVYASLRRLENGETYPLREETMLLYTPITMGLRFSL